MRSRYLAVVLLITALAGPPSAFATDPFEINATTTDGGAPINITVSGSSLIDLVEDAINATGAFADLDGRDYSASLTYGGVEQAIVVDVSADGQTAVLTFPLTGFSMTFNASNRDELEDQIREFIEKDGSRQYAALLRELNRTSIISVVDGNPGATTALMARQSFRRHGLGHSGPQWTRPARIEGEDASGRHWWLSFTAMGDRIEADQFKGYNAGIDLSSGVWLGSHIGLSFAGVALYQDIEGADALHAGLEFGVPIRLMDQIPLGEADLETNAHQPRLSWQIVPYVHGAFGGSVDMAAGGLMIGGGATNRIGVDFGNWSLTMANQISLFDGQDVSYDDYEWETDVDQEVLMNGLLLGVNLSESVYVEAGAAHTRFLSNAAVKEWISPMAGIGIRTRNGGIIGLNYTGNFGSKSYRTHGLGLTLKIAF